jgi:hypothetical protein
MIESFEAIEAPASFESLHGTVPREDSILSVCETVTEFEMQGTKLRRATSDLAPSMIGQKTVSYPELGENWANRIQNFTRNLAVSSTNIHFVEKVKFEHAMKVVADFIPSHGVNHRQFQSFFFV